MGIPIESHAIDKAVDDVQMLILRAYSFIRSQVCDQVELFAESFFKLPMLRRLEDDMAQMELGEEDEKKYALRRGQLGAEIAKADELVAEVSDCIDKLQQFKLKNEAYFSSM